MAEPDQARRKYSEIVDRLEKRSKEGYSRVTLTGRALGRGDDAVHLATETGVVSIPLSEVEGMRQLDKERPDILSVDVRNNEKVTSLFKVNSAFRNLTVVGAFDTQTYTAGDCFDTCTVTGGPNCDATDDFLGCTQIVDDWWV